jgi:hypothetical protein
VAPLTELDIEDNTLQQSLQRTPCATPGAARQFVKFGLRCILETPLGKNETPSSRLAAFPDLRAAIDRVEAWLAGAPFGHWHDVVRGAAGRAGPYKPRLTGPAAAAWAVCHLTDAVGAMIRAGSDVSDLNDVGMHACRAAAFARCATDDGVPRAAIDYQQQLAREMLGGA